MSISLSSLRKVRADRPPRILIYGNEGVGKTTLASEFPGPVFIQTEDGATAGMELDSFGVLGSFEAVMEALESLRSEPHEFQTVVIDSITALQRLVFAETCRRGDEHGNPKSRIEDFGYGKGYVNAKMVMREFLEACNALRTQRDLCVVLIAHSLVARFEDPETASYDRYEIDLHKQIVGEVARDLDAIVFLKKPVVAKEEAKGFNAKRTRAEGSATTVLMHTAGKPAYVAKNRYDMPETIRFERGGGFAALARYFPGYVSAEPQTNEDRKEAA